MTDPYPLLFDPILKEKVWGGRRLARFGKRLRSGTNFGESWEIADLAATSVSGGGGGAAVSVIRNGPLAGETIGKAIGCWGARLLGSAGLERARAVGDQTGAERPVFPLLLKLLDAREHLSVQVHPSPSYSAAHAEAHLKTESWYVIEAEPSSLPGGEPVAPLVFKGLRPGCDPATFSAHIRAGAPASVLHAEPGVPGHCHTLPSGTVHALGAGVLVAEVQTASDTTFRVYDWRSEYRRPERALHIDQALACIDFECPAPPPAVDASSGGRAAQTPYYTIDVVTGPVSIEPGLCRALMVLEGDGSLESPGCQPLGLSPGTTILLPAALRGAVSVSGNSLHGLIVGLSG